MNPTREKGMVNVFEAIRHADIDALVREMADAYRDNIHRLLEVKAQTSSSQFL